MFMTVCVVLVMSSCQRDRLWCIGLCQGVITKRNVVTERMTLNDSSHKHA